MVHHATHNQRGTIMIFVVLTVAVAGFAALYGLSRAGIDAFVDASVQENAWDVRADVMGCVDEMLIQYRVDENYDPAQIDTGEAVCEATVTQPTSETREAVLTLTDEGLTRGVRVEFSLDPVEVTRVVEQYD